MLDDLRAFTRNGALLTEALQGADFAPMLMVLVHLSGEEHWLADVGQYITGPWNFHENAPEAIKQQVRDRLRTVLTEIAEGTRPMPDAPPAHLLRAMLSTGVGQTVPEEYIPMILEETMLFNDRDPKTVEWRSKPDATVPTGESGPISAHDTHLGAPFDRINGRKSYRIKCTEMVYTVAFE